MAELEHEYNQYYMINDFYIPRIGYVCCESDNIGPKVGIIKSTITTSNEYRDAFLRLLLRHNEDHLRIKVNRIVYPRIDSRPFLKQHKTCARRKGPFIRRYKKLFFN